MTILRRPYRVVPWTSLSSAIIDQSIELPLERIEEQMVMEVPSGVHGIELQDIANKLNDSYERALDMNSTGNTTLTAETLRKLDVIVEVTDRKAKEHLKAHPLVNMMKKMVGDDERLKGIITEAEKKALKKSSPTREKMLEDMVDNLHEMMKRDGVIR